MSETSSTQKIAVSDEILTPEKPIQLPRRSRIAFSVKDVKEAALGLQKAQKKSTFQRSDVAGSDGDGEDELLAVEEELKLSSPSSGSVRRSTETRSPTKLPEKYQILIEFFNSMESSVRLLRLKRILPTFSNICSSIQHLTGRRFTYGHLAQLKYILPEAISIRKVLLRDEATCCMMPELQIYLQIDTIEESLKRKEESGYSILRKVFRQRLASFSREHNEMDDVPEETLPHPFDQQIKPNVPKYSARNSTCSVNLIGDTGSEQSVAMASHIPRTFKRQFSQKKLVTDAEKTPLICSNHVTCKDDLPVALSPLKCTFKPPPCKKPLFASPASKSMSSSCNVGEEVNNLNSNGHLLNELKAFEGTPAKLVSTPARLMTATPEIQPPKRHCSTTYDTPVKEQRSARTKLFPTPRKGANMEDSTEVTVSISDDDDVINILPETLLQQIKEKERKAKEEKDNGVAEAKRRKEILASLPKLFDMIFLIFQSGNRSTITKQELIHKIVAGYLSIVDRTEVEQQLKLLKELAPDWISEKMVSTGDFLYSINKISSTQEIRQRLTEAK